METLNQDTTEVAQALREMLTECCPILGASPAAFDGDLAGGPAPAWKMPPAGALVRAVFHTPRGRVTVLVFESRYLARASRPDRLQAVHGVTKAFAWQTYHRVYLQTPIREGQDQRWWRLDAPPDRDDAAAGIGDGSIPLPCYDTWEAYMAWALHLVERALDKAMAEEMRYARRLGPVREANGLMGRSALYRLFHVRGRALAAYQAGGETEQVEKHWKRLRAALSQRLCGSASSKQMQEAHLRAALREMDASLAAFGYDFEAEEEAYMRRNELRHRYAELFNPSLP